MSTQSMPWARSRARSPRSSERVQMDVLRRTGIERPVLAEDRRQHRIAREKGQRHAVADCRTAWSRACCSRHGHRATAPRAPARARRSAARPADAAHGNQMVAADEDRHAARAGRRHRNGRGHGSAGSSRRSRRDACRMRRLCRHRHLDRPGLAQVPRSGRRCPSVVSMPGNPAVRSASGPISVPRAAAPIRGRSREARYPCRLELGQQSGGLQSLEQQALPLVARSSIYRPSTSR